MADDQTFESLFATETRDYLVDNKGTQTKVSSLHGKIVGLYFNCHDRFTPMLVRLSEDLKKENKPFAIVFIQNEPDENKFNATFAKVPFLSIPHSDLASAKKLCEKFEVEDQMGIPILIVLDEHGKTSNTEGRDVICEYGYEGYPFSKEKIDEIIKAKELAKEQMRANQSLTTLLGTPERDWLLGKNGEQVKISTLAGKPVGLYFSGHWCSPCRGFTPRLKAAYEELHKQGKDFEVVFFTFDRDEAGFNEYFGQMPWLAIPYSDKRHVQKVSDFFDVEGIPSLVILNGDGKTENIEGVAAVNDLGAEAYPFTEEACNVLTERKRKEKEEARANQTLSSLLVTAERDWVQGKDSAHVAVASLADNELIGLYFSGHWCGPCRGFTPELAKVYNELKAQGKKFEIIFVSSDRDEDSFNSYYGEMPWLALPFSDRKTKATLSEHFDVEGIPSLVLLNGAGKTVHINARGMIASYGAAGFPYNKERIDELKAEEEKKFAALPKWIKHKEHEHPIELVPSVYHGAYGCDICGTHGSGWAYHCAKCQWDCHPKCVADAQAVDAPKSS